MLIYCPTVEALGLSIKLCNDILKLIEILYVQRCCHKN